MSDTEVSRNRPRPRDRHTKSARTKKVGFALVGVEQAETGEAMATCNCGAEKFHRRRKVVEDWIDKHLVKHHGGRGVRV